jgi:uncharacterized protein YxjI
MGLFSSEPKHAAAPPPPLQRPSNVPIGVFEAFTIHTQPITLKLQEKRFSMSGDDFYIKDALSDQPVLGCKAKSFSLHKRKEFVDARGQPIFRVNKHLMAFHSTFDGLPPQEDDDRVLFTVKSSFSMGGAKINTTFLNAADGQEHILTLKGDFFDRKAAITLGSADGPVVATISRDFWNAREIFSDKQTYYLTIAPGVDVALLCAICVCLDEIRNERKNAAIGSAGASGGGAC